MGNLKIIGETDDLEYEKASVTHYIIADSSTKSIEILGYKFHPNDLESLSEWLELNDNGCISLIYKEPVLKNFGTCSPFFFSQSCFPLLSSNKQWAEKIPGFNFHGFNPLGEVLSKVNTFSFLQESTLHTPKIEANIAAQEVKISGRLIDESSHYYTFFPLISWLDDFLLQNKKSLPFYLGFEYFITAGSKMILDLLTFLKNCKIENLKIIWLYYEDDDDMEEAGKEFKELLNFKDEMVNMVRVN